MIIDWESFKKPYKAPTKGLFPIGSRVYIGRQGKGKTLSMVQYTHWLQERHPKCKVFSNVILRGIKYKLLRSDDDVARALAYQNGQDGVLVLLDEAHLFFNVQSGIPMDVVTAISQQRKDRRRIVFSSQIWNELSMSLRKQVEEVVNCRSFGRIQWNTVYYGDTVQLDKSDYSYVMAKMHTEVYKHNQEYYDRYDTYQKIVRNNQYDNSQTVSAAPLIAVQTDETTKKRRTLGRKLKKV